MKLTRFAFSRCDLSTAEAPFVTTASVFERSLSLCLVPNLLFFHDTTKYSIFQLMTASLKLSFSPITFKLDLQH